MARNRFGRGRYHPYSAQLEMGGERHPTVLWQIATAGTHQLCTQPAAAHLLHPDSCQWDHHFPQSQYYSGTWDWRNRCAKLEGHSYLDTECDVNNSGHPSGAPLELDYIYQQTLPV